MLTQHVHTNVCAPHAASRWALSLTSHSAASPGAGLSRGTTSFNDDIFAHLHSYLGSMCSVRTALFILEATVPVLHPADERDV